MSKEELLFDLDDDEGLPNLYELLGVTSKATDEELRKAYRRAALLTHPDKWAHLDPDSSEARAKTVEFQRVGLAYAVLKDPRRRQIYDQTGSTKDISDLVEEGRDWDAYFRTLWSGVVDATTIGQFAKVYKGSEEERSDILAAFAVHKGDLDGILSEVLLAEVEDEPRIIEIIEGAIEAKELKRTKQYTKSKKGAAKRKKNADAEAEEADALRKELGLDDKLRKIKADKAKKRKRSGSAADGASSDEEEEEEEGGGIKALIRQNHAGRMHSIIANIEAKYGQQKHKKSKKNPAKRGKRAAAASDDDAPSAFVEPSEEEFLALQAKMFANKKSKK
ncbi:hypothetical protein GGI07_003119 [Coemansia sp. Benny D115]|nr:hypothetical protein GGI07_003119 [Coemansia sp. Benny D115]